MSELTDEERTRIAGAVSQLMGATGGTLTESEGNYLRNFGFALIRAGYAARPAMTTDTVREALRELVEACDRFPARRSASEAVRQAAADDRYHDAIRAARAALREDRAEPVDLSSAKVDELIGEAFDKAERNGDGWSDRAAFMAGFVYACGAAPIPEDRAEPVRRKL